MRPASVDHGICSVGPAAAGRDGDRVGVVLDAPHRRTQAHRIAEIVCDGLTDADCSTYDPVLLRTRFDRQQRLEIGAGMGVEGRVQGGEVGALGREHRLGHDPEVRAPQLGAQVRTDPGLERLSVELARLGGEPWLVQRNAVRETVEALQPPEQVSERNGVQVWDRAPVRPQQRRPATKVDHMTPGVVGREGVKTQLGDELVHAVLGRTDPLSAQFDPGTVDRGAPFGATANTVPGLEHRQVDPGGDEPPCRT